MTDIGSMPLDEALQHFGVKGMRWGVSKNAQPTYYDIDDGTPRTFSKKQKAAAFGVAVAGTAVVGVLMKKYGTVDLNSAKKYQKSSKVRSRTAQTGHVKLQRQPKQLATSSTAKLSGMVLRLLQR